jgi:hypothetical protein
VALVSLVLQLLAIPVLIPIIKGWAARSSINR